MTEQNNNNIQFKAPSLPTHPLQTQRPTTVPASATSATQEGVAVTPKPAPGKYDNNFAADFKLPPKVLQTKFVAAGALAILLIGCLLGYVIAPSSSPQQQVVGLQGVVYNPSVRADMYRCGQTDANRRCILYIMNSKRRQLWGRDFFEDASNVVGMQKYLIELNNVEYSDKQIPPGYIAQIYIPERR